MPTFQAPFPQVPKTGVSVVTLACTLADDSPNTAELLTVGTGGGVLTRVSIIARGPINSGAVVALFLQKTGATEKRLISTRLLPAATPSATVLPSSVTFEFTEMAAGRLAAGDKLHFGCMQAVPLGVVGFAQESDY
jgi:hypothetical protein